ncbi:choice-of-anchor D domain-containing protein [candidate division TA06 bacterium]|uniref:Choice-of-anchor D domain-containing protein n=1 Tax=candidate division TA06 bacterium TaxID=2250710 RepID=A0A523UXT3_UNCT6|nr:MAG: choice-of-anchor D domain-containing protein [candidate division TA06 bacterium]
MRFCILVLVAAIAATSSFGEEVVKSFPAPGGYYAYGLTFDGTDLWCGELLDGKIYRVDTASGAVIESIPGPTDDNHALAWDGTCLWVATSSVESKYIHRITTAGVVVDSILCPKRGTSPYPGGLTWDGSYLWVSIYFSHPAQIYKVDTLDGTILDSIRPQGEQPQGLAWDPTGPYLWNCMDNNDGDPELIWKFNAMTGETLLSFPVPDTFSDKRPRGLAWDGQYLWIVSRGPGGPSPPQYIYKIDPGGAGYPIINLSAHSHDYRHTIIGVGDSWQLIIGNVGTADLVVDSLSVDNNVFGFSGVYPETILPGSTYTVDVDFDPTVYGSTSGSLYVYHSDPINPVQSVYLVGFGVYADAEIDIANTLHNWGDIRVRASTRWFLPVVNQGAAPLTLDSLSFTDSNFFLWEEMFPIVVDSTDSAFIPVWFSPQGGTTYAGSLTVYSDDPDESAIPIVLQGTGDPSPYPGGREFWHYEAPGDIFRHVRSIRWIPDINGDSVADVIAVSENDTLYCIHGNGSGTGDVLWIYEVSYVYSDRAMIVVPDIDGDSVPDVVIGTAGGDRSVRAISGADGDSIWRYDTHEYGGGGWVYEVSAVVDLDGDDVVDILAGAGDDGGHTGPERAFALSGVDGTKIWEQHVGAAVFGIREIDDVNGDLIPDVACGTGNTSPSVKGVYCLDGLTGDTIWYNNTGDAMWSVCPIEDINGDSIGDVIAGAMDGTVYALDGVSGAELWRKSVGGIVEHVWVTEDVDGDGYDDVLPGGLMGAMYCLQGDSGNTIWLTPSGHMAFVNVPMGDVTGDLISDCIAGSGFSVNTIFCLDGVTGDTLWTKPSASAVETGWPIPSIDQNGYDDVLIGTREGMILALSGGEPEVGISVERPSSAGDRFRILQNRPNPFYTETTISAIGISPGEKTILKVYDLSGRLVAELSEPNGSGGGAVARLVWDGTDRSGRMVSSGIYFCKPSSGKEARTIKMVRLNRRK